MKKSASLEQNRVRQPRSGGLSGKAAPPVATAREVLVAGSFNDWQPRATLMMTKQRGGKWSTELLLKPGQYEYRFVVDGQWQDDPMAARFVANSFGELNCVVEVKPTAVPAASRP